MARPIFSVVVRELGATTEASPRNGARIRFFDRAPWSGRMTPGRNMYAPWNGRASRAFSVRPFTRAHMERPCSVLSVPAPETYVKVRPGFFFDTTGATESVRSYVTLV